MLLPLDVSFLPLSPSKHVCAAPQFLFRPHNVHHIRLPYVNQSERSDLSDWLTYGSGDQSYPRCRGSVSWTLFNHVLQAGPDKRCKGDYVLRRLSLRRGLGIMALHCVLTGEINTSVFWWWPPQGLQSHWRDLERRDTHSIRERKLNAQGLRVIRELIQLWWTQQMMVWALIAFYTWWATVRWPQNC